jgi:hypothetical protein
MPGQGASLVLFLRFVSLSLGVAVVAPSVSYIQGVRGEGSPDAKPCPLECVHPILTATARLPEDTPEDVMHDEIEAGR